MSTVSHFTAFGSSDNIPSNWPAGLAYNSNEARYLMSVSNAFQIAALDHLHIVAIDVPPLPPPAFNTMTLTLPIQKNLPLGSRMYFFYVSEANEGDALQFIPVTGSGDTVNGDPFSTQFTLSGNKQLFIALGVNGNYIIHEFGADIPDPFVSVPMNSFLGVPNIGPLTYVPKEITFVIQSIGGVWWGYSSNTYDPVVDPKTYYPGMDGYIVPQDAMGVAGFDTPGFLVTQTGRYRITANVGPLYYQLSAPDVHSDKSSRVIIANLSAAAATLDIAYGSAYLTQGGSTSAVYYEGSVSTVMELEAGTYVAVWTAVRNGIHTLITNQSFTDTTKITFEYLPPAPAPVLFSSLRSLAAPEGSSSSSLKSPMHKPVSVDVIKKAQIAAKASLLSAESRKRQNGADHQSSSSSSAQQPSFSLSDMEKMISQALDARDRRQAAISVASNSSGGASSSSSASSFSSSAPPPRNVSEGKRAAAASLLTNDSKKRKVAE